MKSPSRTVLAAARLMEPQLHRGAPVSLAQLRERVRAWVPGRAFETAVFELADAGRICLHSHDLPSELTDDERRAYIPNDRGSYFMALVLR